jgi:hypothetical protein
MVMSKESSLAESVNASEGNALYERGGRTMQNERIVVNVGDDEAVASFSALFLAQVAQ